MYAQGFVHAQERFFEMDVRRHATAGRLAELFGEDRLETDIYVRTMGWRRVAERELPLLDPDTRVALDAYADGVNAYLEDRSPSQIALEYAFLDASGVDYRPEPWTARRLPRLAQGDGVGPARQHGRGDRPGAPRRRWGRSGPTSSSPPTTPRPRPRSSRRAPSSTASSSRTPNPAAPATRPGPAAYAPVRAGPLRRLDGRARRGCPPGSAAATGSAATPGWSRASTPTPASRCWPTTPTWASRCPASGCRSGCTAAPSSEAAPTTSPGSPSPACPA